MLDQPAASHRARLRDRPRLAALAVALLLAMDVGYAVYMEDFDGAQDGVVNQGAPAYPVR